MEENLINTPGSSAELEELTDGGVTTLHSHPNGGGASTYAEISASDPNTDVTGAQLEELSDGSQTTLHSHAATVPTYAQISAGDAGTDITAAELEELTDGSTTALHDHSGLSAFVDRGDPSSEAWDVVVGDLTTDGTYRDLDFGSGGLNIVPAGTKAILLSVDIVDATPNLVFKCRKNGSTSDYTNCFLRNQVSDVDMNGIMVVPCDASGIIEYNAQNTSWTGINLFVLGWWV